MAAGGYHALAGARGRAGPQPAGTRESGATCPGGSGPRPPRPPRRLAGCNVPAVLRPPASSGWPADPLTNVPLCTTAFSSQIGAAVTDQRGGAIAVWYEDRGGDFDIFARRVDSSGPPRWTADGVRVCVAPAGTSQILPKAVSDGAGGLIAVWIDGRSGPNALYAQHVDSSGVRQWGD